mmetsp:Transcript_20657/g.48212  ORF Transcript_20657/g.48212 Transcript_20657/m.48212 type:complete len:86 (-) Transcript_20657:272-529(-)
MPRGPGMAVLARSLPRLGESSAFAMWPFGLDVGELKPKSWEEKADTGLFLFNVFAKGCVPDSVDHPRSIAHGDLGRMELSASKKP